MTAATPGVAGRLIADAFALLPGIALAGSVAVVAWAIAPNLPFQLGDVPLALLLGLALASVGGLPQRARPGVTFSAQRLLRIGIILVGAKISFDVLGSIGPWAILLVLAVMTCSFGLNIGAAKLFGIPGRLGLLIGVGNSVCGNTAIAATAPVIGAESGEVSFAMTTITIFGTVSVFAFPAIAVFTQLPAAVYGAWCGVAINDTSQVIAASTVLGPVSLQTATVVKLIRNAVMAPLLVIIGWRQARRTGTVRPGLRTVATAVPPFVLGFLAVAWLRTVGVISSDLASVLAELSHWAILLALAGVGLATRLTEVRTLGYKPLVVGVSAASIVAGVTFAVLVSTK